MKLVRVGAATVNTTPLDWDGNRRGIQAAISEARDQGVSVLCLPEMCITGYGVEDMFHSRAVLDAAPTADARALRRRHLGDLEQDAAVALDERHVAPRLGHTHHRASDDEQVGLVQGVLPLQNLLDVGADAFDEVAGGRVVGEEQMIQIHLGNTPSSMDRRSPPDPQAFSLSFSVAASRLMS